jgi:hypothetical protein
MPLLFIPIAVITHEPGSSSSSTGAKSADEALTLVPPGPAPSILIDETATSSGVKDLAEEVRGPKLSVNVAGEGEGVSCLQAASKSATTRIVRKKGIFPIVEDLLRRIRARGGQMIQLTIFPLPKNSSRRDGFEALRGCNSAFP